MPARTRINGGVPTTPVGRPDVVWGLPGQGGLLTEWAETVPDLTWPESIRTYGRMRRDPKISAVLNAFFMPMLRTNWAVDPSGVNQAKSVDLVASDLGLPVLGEKGPPPAQAGTPGFHWGEHLRLALLNYVFGFFPFERWYTTSPKAKDGLTHLAGLDERLPHTIAMIDLDDNGQISSVTQNTQLNPLKANRLLWYVNEREGANWAGVSMLRAAYTPWVLKHETMRVHATSIRRWGMGMPVVKAPPGGTPGQISQAQQLASGMRAGDTAGVGLPDGFTVEIAGMTGSVPDALGFLNYCDQQIASAALAVFLELGLSSGGARALGDTFVDMFLLSLQASADAIADTVTFGAPTMPGICRALTDINFGEDEPCPRIVAVDVGDRHEITATAIQQLVACGAVQPDDGLEAFIRQAWDFPARTTPRTPPPPPKGAPGAPGSGGPPAPPGTPTGPGSGKPPGPGTPPASPQPVSQQPNMYAPPTGPPGRRGGQPAISSAETRAAAGSGGGLRRPLTELEAAAGLDPEAMRTELEIATNRVLTQWNPVLKQQRTELADQVAAAVDDGQIHQLAALTAPAGDAPDLLYRAMAAVAARAAGRMVGEAAAQGVTIDLAKVQLNHGRLRQIAAARAALAGQQLANAASRRALQVVTASAGTDAARQVTAELAGLSPNPLADQLRAAMHSAANEARFAVLDAGPEAVYTATELADDPNCCQPCQDVDGQQFASLEDARAHYANGAYIGCLGGLRCRGTVVASWPHNQAPSAPDIDWPHHLTPPPDLGTGPDVAAGGFTIEVTLRPGRELPAWHQPAHATLASAAGEVDRLRAWSPPGPGTAIREVVVTEVAAGFDPGQLRDPHTGEWIREGGGAARKRPKRADPLAPPSQRGPTTPSRRSRPVITAAEARGNSRAVSYEQFQHLAAIGNQQIDQMKRDSSPITALDEHWDKTKTETFAKVKEPWGGATINSHTAEPLPDGADKYAISVKPAHMHTVSVPEGATYDEFSAAMDHAKELFRPALERRSFYLGIFHDDENNRIDIDPVAVVDTPDEVETVGAYTRAIGGAYHFKTGNGYWPPHVREVTLYTSARTKRGVMSEPTDVHFKGPGQWRSQAARVQEPLTDDQWDAEDTDDSTGSGGKPAD
jgi:hypothetical protein